MRHQIDSAAWTGHTGVRGITVIVQRPGLYIAFHWRCYLTSIQWRKPHQPLALAIAGWPLGTLEISFI